MRKHALMHRARRFIAGAPACYGVQYFQTNLTKSKMASRGLLELLGRRVALPNRFAHSRVVTTGLLVDLHISNDYIGSGKRTRSRVATRNPSCQQRRVVANPPPSLTPFRCLICYSGPVATAAGIAASVGVVFGVQRLVPTMDPTWYKSLKKPRCAIWLRYYKEGVPYGFQMGVCSSSFPGPEVTLSTAPSKCAGKLFLALCSHSWTPPNYVFPLVWIPLKTMQSVRCWALNRRGSDPDVHFTSDTCNNHLGFTFRLHWLHRSRCGWCAPRPRACR